MNSRAVIVAVAIVLLTACGVPGPLPGTRGAPALEVSLPTAYSLTDTTKWGNPLEDGERAILRLRGVAIDTVDLDAGVSVVGADSLVYLPVRTDTVPFSEDQPDLFENFTAEYVLWTPHSVRELRALVPHFNSYFSSPVISASTLYYWGIGPEQPMHRIYAMRYDFRTGQVDSLFVNEEDLATDYRYYFRLPRVIDGAVRFGRFTVDRRTWRLIAAEPPSN